MGGGREGKARGSGGRAAMECRERGTGGRVLTSTPAAHTSSACQGSRVGGGRCLSRMPRGRPGPVELQPNSAHGLLSITFPERLSPPSLPPCSPLQIGAVQGAAQFLCQLSKGVSGVVGDVLGSQVGGRASRGNRDGAKGRAVNRSQAPKAGAADPGHRTCAHTVAVHAGGRVGMRVGTKVVGLGWRHALCNSERLCWRHSKRVHPSCNRDPCLPPSPQPPPPPPRPACWCSALR